MASSPEEGRDWRAVPRREAEMIARLYVPGVLDYAQLARYFRLPIGGLRAMLKHLDAGHAWPNRLEFSPPRALPTVDAILAASAYRPAAPEIPPCPRGKIGYQSIREAHTAAREYSARSGHELRGYQCPYCALWHIGHPRSGRAMSRRFLAERERA